VDLEIIEKNPVDGIVPYDKAPLRPGEPSAGEALEKLYPATHGVRVWGSSMGPP
jgi:hypothetical protein